MTSGIAYLRSTSLDAAVLETLAYFDVFDFPPRAEEIHRYLHGMSTSLDAVQDALEHLIHQGRLVSRDGRFALAGRGSLFDLYRSSSQEKARRLPKALRYGRLLARLPFIRMAAVTGSVAMQNGGAGADYDFLLVTASRRVWLGRAFAILVGRWSSFHGDTLCPNSILSERAWVWPQRDIYAAHELAQMIPVSGLDLYMRFRNLNTWTDAYLPNSGGAPSSASGTGDRSSAFPSVLEIPFRGRLGDFLEDLEMRRKVRRFQRHSAFGPETDFSADVCRGNFLNHGGQALGAFQRRLGNLALTTAVSDKAAVSSPKPSVVTALQPQLTGQKSAGLSSLPRLKGSRIAND